MAYILPSNNIATGYKILLYYCHPLNINTEVTLIYANNPNGLLIFSQFKPDVEATELALAFPITPDLSNMTLAKVL